MPLGAVILRSRSFLRLGVRLSVTVWLVPAGSVQQRVARMGLVPSQVKECVWVFAAVVSVPSMSLGLARLALCARMRSAAAFTLR